MRSYTGAICRPLKSSSMPDKQHRILPPGMSSSSITQLEGICSLGLYVTSRVTEHGSGVVSVTTVPATSVRVGA